MTTTAEKFQIVTTGFGQRLEGVSENASDLPTPCEGWTVRQLVDHACGSLDFLLDSVDRNVDDGATDLPTQRWQRRVDAVTSAIADPQLASTPVNGPMGVLALKQVAGGAILHDILVHTWDLAYATGQDTTLDADIAAAALAKMTPFDELLRGPGMFGPKASPPSDADAQTQLLCFLGRQLAT